MIYTHKNSGLSTLLALFLGAVIVGGVVTAVVITNNNTSLETATSTMADSEATSSDSYENFMDEDTTETTAESESETETSADEAEVDTDTDDSQEAQVDDSDDTTTDADNDPEPSNSVTVVSYTDSGFSPSTVTISSGETVRFENDSSGRMWVASNEHPTHREYSGTSLDEHCPDASGDSFDQCESGDSFSFTFNQTGEFDYHNHNQFSDTGTVIVE